MISSSVQIITKICVQQNRMQQSHGPKYVCQNELWYGNHRRVTQVTSPDQQAYHMLPGTDQAVTDDH